MEPKHAKGQRVIIISVDTPHGQPKYPDLDEHVGKSGVVLGSHPAQYETHGTPVDIWGYTVRIETDNRELTVLEDALDRLD